MPVCCVKNSFTKNEADWHSFIYSSKDKANNKHEILIHFIYRHCGIQL